MSEKKTAADYVDNRGDCACITLSRSTSVDGVATSTLRMREPVVGDQERYAESTESEARKEIAMFANLCEVSPDVIRSLPLRDYIRLQVAYAGFTD